MKHFCLLSAGCLCCIWALFHFLLWEQFWFYILRSCLQCRNSPENKHWYVYPHLIFFPWTFYFTSRNKSVKNRNVLKTWSGHSWFFFFNLILTLNCITYIMKKTFNCRNPFILGIYCGESLEFSLWDILENRYIRNKMGKSNSSY